MTSIAPFLQGLSVAVSPSLSCITQRFREGHCPSAGTPTKSHLSLAQGLSAQVVTLRSPAPHLLSQGSASWGVPVCLGHVDHCSVDPSHQPWPTWTCHWAEIKVMMTMAHNSYYLHRGSARVGPGHMTQNSHGAEEVARRLG